MYFHPSKGSPFAMVLTWNDPQEDFEDFWGILGSFLIPLSAKLTGSYNTSVFPYYYYHCSPLLLLLCPYIIIVMSALTIL